MQASRVTAAVAIHDLASTAAATRTPSHAPSHARVPIEGDGCAASLLGDRRRVNGPWECANFALAASNTLNRRRALARAWTTASDRCLLATATRRWRFRLRARARRR